jgi:hypothetical protein
VSDVQCFVAAVFIASRTYHFLLTDKPGEGIMTYVHTDDKACINFGSLSATFEFLSRFGDRTADLVSQSGDRHLVHSGDVALISLTGLIV